MGFARRIAFMGVVVPLVAQGPRATWSFEFQGGNAWSLPGPLVIEREGRSGWSLRAHWNTRPFEGGQLRVGNLALHALLGAGRRW